MKLTPEQRIAVINERLAANISMLGFAMAKASDAMAEFAFASACADGTTEAKRAEEITDAAIARAGITEPPYP